MTNLNTGDIMVSSWGCDQTNVDFYKVTKTSGAFATIRRLRASAYSDDNGTMEDRCVPTDEFMPDAECYPKATMRRKVIDARGEPMLKINSHSFARKWDGNPKRRSWYA